MDKLSPEFQRLVGQVRQDEAQHLESQKQHHAQNQEQTQAKRDKLVQVMRTASQISRLVFGVVPEDIVVIHQEYTSRPYRKQGSVNNAQVASGWKVLTKSTSHDPNAGSKTVSSSIVTSTDGVLLTRDGALAVFKSTEASPGEISKVYISNQRPISSGTDYLDTPTYSLVDLNSGLPKHIEKMSTLVPLHGLVFGADAIEMGLAKLIMPKN